MSVDGNKALLAIFLLRITASSIFCIASLIRLNKSFTPLGPIVNIYLSPSPQASLI